MPVSAARAAAFDILLRVERESSFASELLHTAAFDRLSTQDHALATELVMGVLRWRSRLDDEIAGAATQPLRKLDLEILVALRLALYQFRYLDRIPQRAALHESVELVKRSRKRSAVPFVNAVLRKLSSTVQSRPIQTRELLADPPADDTLDSPESLAREFAHPLWLVQRWVQEYSSTVAREICHHNQSIPKSAIRLRAADTEKQHETAGITLTPGRILQSARLVQSGDVTKTETFRNREIVIQDEASQLVALLAAQASQDPGSEVPRSNIPRSEIQGSNILDCCAAPGGKTLAIADRNPGAAIIAVELHPHRARLLRQLLGLSRSGERIRVIAADARNLPLSRTFDAVLADVPCSGTGTLARNPEIKWRLTPGDLPELQQRQLAILNSAMTHVAPGGRIVYSTCSLEKEENEDVVEQALRSDTSFRPLDCQTELNRLRGESEIVWPDTASSLTRGLYLRTIPGIHPCEGFFAAILEKRTGFDESLTGLQN